MHPTLRSLLRPALEGHPDALERFGIACIRYGQTNTLPCSSSLPSAPIVQSPLAICTPNYHQAPGKNRHIVTLMLLGCHEYLPAAVATVAALHACRGNTTDNAMCSSEKMLRHIGMG